MFVATILLLLDASDRNALADFSTDVPLISYESKERQLSWKLPNQGNKLYWWEIEVYSGPNLVSGLTGCGDDYITLAPCKKIIYAQIITLPRDVQFIKYFRVRALGPRSDSPSSPWSALQEISSSVATRPTPSLEAEFRVIPEGTLDSSEDLQVLLRLKNPNDWLKGTTVMFSLYPVEKKSDSRAFYADPETQYKLFVIGEKKNRRIAARLTPKNHSGAVRQYYVVAGYYTPGQSKVTHIGYKQISVMPNENEPPPGIERSCQIDFAKKPTAEKIYCWALWAARTQFSVCDDPGTESGRLGCAFSTSRLLKFAGLPVEEVYMTSVLYQKLLELEENNVIKRVRMTDSVPGCVVISPTRDYGSNIYGHIGIVMHPEGRVIGSNSSNLGFFKYKSHTAQSWLKYYGDLGLDTEVFCPTDSIKITTGNTTSSGSGKSSATGAPAVSLESSDSITASPTPVREPDRISPPVSSDNSVLAQYKNDSILRSGMYEEVSGIDTILAGQAFTVSVWVDGYGNLFGADGSIVINVSASTVSVGTKAGSYCGGPWNNKAFVAQIPSALSNGKRHIVYVRSANGDEAIYVSTTNSFNQIASTNRSGIIPTGCYGAFFGKTKNWEGNLSGSWFGTMQMRRLYDKALTQTQIQALWSEQKLRVNTN